MIQFYKKTIIFFAAIMLLSSTFYSQTCSDLFFSEYAEGSSNNKYVEIYNPTAASITLTGNYTIVRYANGSSTGATISLMDSIPAFGTYIVANPNSNSTILAAVAINGMTSSFISMNGDDALALFHGTDTLDIFGEIGFDPGSYWGTTPNRTQNNTLIRKSTVTIGDSTNPVSFDPSLEWIGIGIDTFTNMNTHTSSCNVSCTPTRDTVESMVCEGDSATNGVKFYKTTGFHADTLTAVSTGCDSILVLNLTINLFDRDTTQDTICQGTSLMFGTQTLTMAGTYSDTAQNTAGCDSISTLELFVTPKMDTVLLTTVQDSTIVVCASSVSCLDSIVSANVYCGPSDGTITFDPITLCMTYTPDTNFVGCDTLCIVLCDTSAGVCDTIIGLIKISPRSIDTIQDTICQGASIVFGTQTLTLSGTYFDTSQSASGSDSITVMELLVNDYLRDTTQDTICQGTSLMFGTKTLTMAGTYSDTAQNTAGCDSISTMELVVTPALRDSMKDTICQGASVTFGAQTLTMSGNYSDTSQNASGCDSITVMTLLVNDFIRDTVKDTICQGANVTFGTQTLTSSGNYFDTAQNASGCDSITVMELLVTDYKRDTISDTICQGASIVFATRTLTMSGNYYDTAQTMTGCDSIIVMQLLVNTAPTKFIFDSICLGDTFTFGSKLITIAGIHRDTIQLTTGCDSIVVLDLKTKSYSRTDNFTICPGDSIVSGVNTYKSAGTYTHVYSSSMGCDSAVTTVLGIYPTSAGSRSYLFCKGDSVLVLGNWYFHATVVNDTIVGGGQYGCDSITIHTINTKTVSPPLNLGNDIVACVNGGVTLFASSAYDTYSWSTGGTTNSIAISGTSVGSTDYILNVTQASSGCSATDTVNITFKICVGITEADVDINVNLYPNPASDFVTIDVFDKYNKGNLTLDVVNSMGQVVISKTIQSVNDKVIMDVSNLSKGLYFVRISSDKISMTKKLIIQN